MTDASPPDLSKPAEAQTRLEQLRQEQVEKGAERVDTASISLTEQQSRALRRVAQLDATERGLRDLLEEVRAQLRTEAIATNQAGVSQLKISEALNRSRTLVQTWLKAT